MPLTRISVTVPEDLLARADRQARRLDRSRSWLVAEALRRFLTVGPSTGAARQPVPSPGVSGLGAQRRAQLEADLRLAPEERVKEAERTARAADRPASRGRRDRLISFERYEDYLDWKRREDVG